MFLNFLLRRGKGKLCLVLASHLRMKDWVQKVESSVDEVF